MAKRKSPKLYANVQFPELFANVKNPDLGASSEQFLDQLRQEYEAGDRLAMNEAFLYCHYCHCRVPRWVAAALPVRLDEELHESKRGKKRALRFSTETARFETVIWFVRRGNSVDEACALAARAFGVSAWTIETAYKSHRRRWKLPPGLPPLPSKKGWTPADLSAGPKKALIPPKF